MTVVQIPVGDVESVKNAFKAAFLSPGFDQLLDEVDAKVGGGFETPWQGQVGSVYTYERAILETYPALEIISVNSTYDPDAEEAAASHRISLDWTQVGSDEETVTRDVERLVLATRLLLRRGVLNSAVGLGPLLIEFEDYSNVGKGPNAANPLIKGGRTVFTAQTWAL